MTAGLGNTYLHIVVLWFLLETRVKYFFQHYAKIVNSESFSNICAQSPFKVIPSVLKYRVMPKNQKVVPNFFCPYLHLIFIDFSDFLYRLPLTALRSTTSQSCKCSFQIHIMVKYISWYSKPRTATLSFYPLIIIVVYLLFIWLLLQTLARKLITVCIQTHLCIGRWCVKENRFSDIFPKYLSKIKEEMFSSWALNAAKAAWARCTHEHRYIFSHFS